MKTYRSVVTVALVSGVVALVGCARQGASPTAPSTATPDAAALAGAPAGGAGRVDLTSASTAAPAPSAANFEIKFLTDMIDHHHMAVMMGEICVGKAIHEELRSLCQDIIAAQTREIEQMQTWLQQWYEISHEPEMKPGDMKMMDRLASLSGAAFEIEFMEMMIKHHEKAIKEGRRCLDKAYHAELRSLCENIIRSQSQEIALMQTWLCQWYGRCR